MSRFKFTPEVRNGLVERTAEGVSLADACRAESLRLNTVKGWLRRGRPQMARKGSVQAAKLRWEMFRSEDVPEAEHGDILDERE